LKDVRLLNAGEQGLVVEFGTTVDKAVNAKIHYVATMLRKLTITGVGEIVPTYRSLMVYFDPLVISREKLVKRVQQILPEAGVAMQKLERGQVVEIPVCYGGEYGPDLEFVANHTGLGVDEVIAVHTAAPYMIYMLGFMPGFPYLGGMPEVLSTPRLEKPRTVIPAGSVGIAGSQTGFYPVESPGGWQIIGRTPLKAFDKDATDPFLFQAGDYLRFRSIAATEFAAIEAAVSAGTYQVTITPLAEKDKGEAV
jgi:inhibitor of KinA